MTWNLPGKGSDVGHTRIKMLGTDGQQRELKPVQSVTDTLHTCVLYWCVYHLGCCCETLPTYQHWNCINLIQDSETQMKGALPPPQSGQQISQLFGSQDVCMVPYKNSSAGSNRVQPTRHITVTERLPRCIVSKFSFSMLPSAGSA